MADQTLPLTPHRYAADEQAAADHRDRLPCQHCPLPAGNRIHDEDAAQALDAAQAEHRRRVGDED